MVIYLRNLGFDSFNFDLIYGLPGQSTAGWEKTLSQVLQLRPNRLAVYSYAHVPWIRPVQRSFKDSDLPDPQQKMDLFLKAYEVLTQNGYRVIGMDHFALEEDDLTQALDQGTIHRNFMGYSTHSDDHQIGFGVSAISFVGGNYFQNKKKIRSYEDSIGNNQLPTFRGFLLSQDDALHRELITQIMCQGNLNIPQFEKNWNIDFWDYFPQAQQDLRPLQEDGLVELKENSLSATETGKLFLRNIAMVFDPYLEKIQEKATTPTFSKTV